MAIDLYYKETDSGCCFDHHVDDSCLYYSSDFDFELKCNSRFARNVSFNNSAIHVPVDVHKNGMVALYQYTSCLHTLLCIIDTKILCFVRWSCGLDDHFKNQSEDVLHSLGITYQYFGSREGVLRYYPGECSSDNIVSMHVTFKMIVFFSPRQNSIHCSDNAFKHAHYHSFCSSICPCTYVNQPPPQ